MAALAEKDVEGVTIALMRCLWGRPHGLTRQLRTCAKTKSSEDLGTERAVVRREEVFLFFGSLSTATFRWMGTPISSPFPCSAIAPLFRCELSGARSKTRQSVSHASMLIKPNPKIAYHPSPPRALSSPQSAFLNATQVYVTW